MAMPGQVEESKKFIQVSIKEISDASLREVTVDLGCEDFTGFGRGNKTGQHIEILKEMWCFKATHRLLQDSSIDSCWFLEMCKNQNIVSLLFLLCPIIQAEEFDPKDTEEAGGLSKTNKKTKQPVLLWKRLLGDSDTPSQENSPFSYYRISALNEWVSAEL